MSPRQVDWLVITGAVVVLYRGVYRAGGAAESFEQRVMAACLAANGVASHRCAAALWELRGCEPGLVEVTVVGRRRPELPGVLAHGTAQLARVDATVHRVIPVTSPARTLIDLSTVVSREVTESALEDALHRRLVNVSWAHRTAERSGRRGAVVRSLLDERAPGQVATESVLEDELVRVLVRGGLPPPVRQLRLGPFRFDASYPESRLLMEAQSVKWHTGAADLQRDCEKLNYLTQNGWRLLVFTAHDVRRRPAWVVRTVRAARTGAVPLGA